MTSVLYMPVFMLDQTSTENDDSRVPRGGKGSCRYLEAFVLDIIPLFCLIYYSRKVTNQLRFKRCRNRLQLLMKGALRICGHIFIPYHGYYFYSGNKKLKQKFKFACGKNETNFLPTFLKII